MSYNNSSLTATRWKKLVYLAAHAFRIAAVVGELDGVDGVHLKAQQLERERGRLVPHVA